MNLSAAIALRQRLQRQLSDSEPIAQRWDRFVRLQRANFALLHASPRGFDHFLRRNMTARRVEVIDGQWRPISATRRADEV